MNKSREFPDDFEDADKELESCPHCFGAGAWHDCGEDTCCCLDPESNEYCKECGGTGEILVPIRPLAHAARDQGE